MDRGGTTLAGLPIFATCGMDYIRYSPATGQGGGAYGQRRPPHAARQDLARDERQHPAQEEEKSAEGIRNRLKTAGCRSGTPDGPDGREP